MAGFLVFFLPFILVLLSVFPGLFDTTMMSRLAVYPLAGTAVLYLGRKNISLTHLAAGAAVALLPALALVWSTSATGGIPYAVRWFSFGMMIAGFSGTVGRWGIKPHLAGLVAAAVLVSVASLTAGADTLTGNPNRAGMVLSLGFLSSLVIFRRDRWYSWAATAVTGAGVIFSSFYISWVSCTAGVLVLVFSGRFRIRPWMILSPMIAGQILVSFFPGYAGRIGPTLELRTRIWRNSITLLKSHLPTGTGTGSARLEIFTSAEPELRTLAGENKRIDYLHSEPLTLITETGIPGVLLLVFFLYWFFKKCRSTSQMAMLAAFWPVFSSDLPLATPLGALPSALFVASVTPLSNRKVNIPAFVSVVILLFSLFWSYSVITGYSLMSNTRTVADAEQACRRIPWEERIFLRSGQMHLYNNMVLAALEDSEHFLELYPEYYRGWELRASALDAAGRESCSAWARAALLVPENIDLPDRYLFALNSIPPEGMDPDTAVAVSVVLSFSREKMSDLVSRMNSDETILMSAKLLNLSLYCREVSMYHAGRMWFQSLICAVDADGPVPADLGFNLLNGRDLYLYLDQDWKPRAEEYLELLSEKMGMDLLSAPSP